MGLRNSLYKVAWLLGDVNAVKKRQGRQAGSPAWCRQGYRPRPGQAIQVTGAILSGFLNPFDAYPPVLIAPTSVSPQAHLRGIAVLAPLFDVSSQSVPPFSV